VLLRGAARATSGLEHTVIGDHPDGVFQIASVGKQFIACAVLMLVRDGKLDLHEPVARWFPDPLPQWRDVTMHHLLTHTSGVPHWTFEGRALNPISWMPHRERLDELERTPLETSPGQRWHYSSPGYLLVGDIFERAAGVPYAEFARERIVARLGLTETYVGQRPSTAVPGHREGEPASEIDAVDMTGTGDHWATASDLARMVSALHGGDLLPPEDLALLRTPHAEAKDHYYGYGVHIGEFAGEPAFWHGGDNPGYRSMTVWLARRQAAIVVLSNEESTDTKEVAHFLAGDRD
jgi:CubicO group peptidase (beta-lactamase class C family)